jgi:hypothetical protein
MLPGVFVAIARDEIKFLLRNKYGECRQVDQSAGMIHVRVRQEQPGQRFRSDARLDEDGRGGACGAFTAAQRFELEMAPKRIVCYLLLKMSATAGIHKQGSARMANEQGGTGEFPSLCMGYAGSGSLYRSHCVVKFDPAKAGLGQRVVPRADKRVICSRRQRPIADEETALGTRPHRSHRKSNTQSGYAGRAPS